MFLFLILFSSIAIAQKPTQESVDKLIYMALEMDESKKDSLELLAIQIQKDGSQIGYHLGAIYYHRFMGWIEEYNGNFDKAIEHYLAFLEEAKTNKFESEELQALNDLGSIYINTNRLEAAKAAFYQGLIKTDSSKRAQRKSAFYNNMGIVYKKQGKLDSALYMYTKSMKIKEILKDSFAIANLKINTSALLIELGKYAEAEEQISENITYCERNNRKSDLWHNLTNLADIKLKTNKVKEAQPLAQKSLSIAIELDSKHRQAETMILLSLIHENLGEFAKALDFQRKSNRLKEEYINEQSNEQINQLREEFNAEQRERENELLNDKLSSEQQKQVYFWSGIGLLVILLAVIGFALNKNRKKNEVLTAQNKLIIEQKDKLTELNDEKNSLISVVSHDLRSPFNAIAMWNKTLEENLNKSPLKVAESVEAIEKMATYGQNLINNILDIEQMEISTHKVDIQKHDLIEICQELIADFAPASKGKKIEIIFENHLASTEILTDRNLLRRALENLISNALKFSHSSTNVIVKLNLVENKPSITVIDKGIGIAEKEQTQIFSKYGQTSSKPTAGEESTGLGLSIVKRIMEELGGNVIFKSEIGVGSEFTLIL